jgi:acyl carrier protein
MTNLEKYNGAFITILGVEESQLPELQYQDVDAWDSIGHMNLIGELEDVFDIEMETDDVIGFSCYAKGKDILKKYDVEI